MEENKEPEDEKGNEAVKIVDPGYPYPTQQTFLLKGKPQTQTLIKNGIF